MAIQNEEQLRMNLAKNMRYLRCIRIPHVSQTMLANKLGVTQTSINRYETAQNLPPTHVLKAMADYFGYTTDELLSDKLPAKKGMKK